MSRHDERRTSQFLKRPIGLNEEKGKCQEPDCRHPKRAHEAFQWTLLSGSSCFEKPAFGH
jgi:hypothetical protein